MKKRYSASNVEWRYLEQLVKGIEDEKVENRIYNVLVWYVIKAERYKLFEYLLNAVTLAAPTVIMMMNMYFPKDSIWGQGAIAGAGTLAAAAKSFSKLHEKRINYRKAAENIKNETTLYINQVGAYAGNDRKAVFLGNIERIIKEENAGWVKVETGKTTKDGGTDEAEKTG